MYNDTKILRKRIKSIVKIASATGLNLIEKIKFRFRYVISPIDQLLLISESYTKICDIGCGNGLFLLLVAKILHKDVLYGLDIDSRAIETASMIIHKNVEEKHTILLECYDGYSIPTKISDYDCIFLNDVLHHIPRDRQQAYLTSLCSKMTSGTALVIKDIEKNHLFVWFNRIHDFILSHSGGFEVSSKDLRKQLSVLGLTEKLFWKKTIFWYPHYCLMYVKD